MPLCGNNPPAWHLWFRKTLSRLKRRAGRAATGHHELHCAMRPRPCDAHHSPRIAESHGDLRNFFRKIAGFFFTAPAQGGESYGKSRGHSHGFGCVCVCVSLSTCLRAFISRRTSFVALFCFVSMMSFNTLGSTVLVSFDHHQMLRAHQNDQFSGIHNNPQDENKPSRRPMIW